MNISVVVPVYNSEGSLPLLVERLAAVLKENADSFELILVDDGSRDASWMVIAELAEEQSWITGIQLARNYGQHNALLCGIREASYEVIITIDDDLQHPPEEIPKLLAKLSQGFDVVYGAPNVQQHGVLRNLASRITKTVLKGAMGVETAAKVSAFRGFRTSTRDAFSSYDSPYVSIDVLLTWATARFAAVDVNHDPRRVGTSNYTPRKLVKHALTMMTGFSTMPLQIASIGGLVFTGMGLLVLTYVVGSALIRGRTVPGFAFLASTIALFSGVQLFALGMIGEYLARMHFRSMGKPTYAIRSTNNTS
jgi:undecaprenyl-phosphate 4-deoxy-4-formamido-L-arabinose transferase